MKLSGVTKMVKRQLVCNVFHNIKSDDFYIGTIRDIDLSERIYTCECGYVEDRDINAAKNILAEAKNIAK